MSEFANISQYSTYNNRMAQSMFDKLFFVDKIDVKGIVDIGSADGSLIRHLMHWMPDDTRYLGFDNDEQQNRIANSALMSDETLTDSQKNNAMFWHSWKSVSEYVDGFRSVGGRLGVVLSSIIHEVYHYSEPQEIDAFWKRIFSLNCDYIIIRDMIPSETIDRQADTDDVMKVLNKYRGSKELKDFERRWGSIQNNKNLNHFLLKYRYTQPNWEREVKENYLPLYWEDLMALLPSGYSVLYHEHGVLPFIKRQVRCDFGIDMKDATHLKLILEKR